MPNQYATVVPSASFGADDVEPRAFLWWDDNLIVIDKAGQRVPSDEQQWERLAQSQDGLYGIFGSGWSTWQVNLREVDEIDDPEMFSDIAVDVGQAAANRLEDVIREANG